MKRLYHFGRKRKGHVSDTKFQNLFIWVGFRVCRYSFSYFGKKIVFGYIVKIFVEIHFTTAPSGQP